MKALLILGGSNAEKNLTYYAEKCLRYINKAIGPLPRNEHDNVLDLNLELLVSIVEQVFPCEYFYNIYLFWIIAYCHVYNFIYLF